MPDLLCVEEQLPRAFLGMWEGARSGHDCDVHLPKPNFSSLDGGVGVGQLRATVPQGLDLASTEHEACLDALDNLVVMKRGAVLRDVACRGFPGHRSVLAQSAAKPNAAKHVPSVPMSIWRQAQSTDDE